MTPQAKWVNREVDLSPGAGYTLTNAQFVTDASTSAGTWDMLFGDLTLMHSDGSIIQLFDRGTSFGFGSYFANGGGVSGQSSIVETVTTSTVEPTPAIAAMPEITTTYYVSDQIGSARSEVSFGSWPLWWGSFDPFGVETDTNTTPNNFKFTGQERDAESGNDYFNARSYASNLGRFISPDPGWLTAIDPQNPQTWNQYAYVMNNPLVFTDPTGMDCSYNPDNYAGLSGTCDGVGDPEPQSGPQSDQNGGNCVSDGSGNLKCDAWKPGIPITPPSQLPCTPSCPVIMAGPFDLGTRFARQIWAQVGQPSKQAPSNGQVPVHGPWTYGNHCGAGGMGNPINGTDAACQTHDACYDQAGFTPGSNFQGGNAQLQACNQQLCNAVRGARQSIINQAAAAGTRTSRGVSPVYTPAQWSELQADSDINLFFTYIVPGANSCH